MLTRLPSTLLLAIAASLGGATLAAAEEIPSWARSTPLERGIQWRSVPNLYSQDLADRGAEPIGEGGIERRHSIRGELVTYWREAAVIYRCVDHYVRDIGFSGGYCDRAEGNNERWGAEVDRAIRDMQQRPRTRRR